MRLPLATKPARSVAAVAGTLVLLVAVLASGCSAPEVGGSREFLDTIKARTSHVAVTEIGASDGALTISLSLDEEVDDGEIRETLDWAMLHFSASKRTQFYNLRHGSVPFAAWQRYEVITAVGSVGEQNLFTYTYDETQPAPPDGRPVTCRESTSFVMPTRLIRGRDADGFRQTLLSVCPDAGDVVLEKLIFFQDSVVVKLMFDSPPSEDTVEEAKALVLGDLLQRPSIVSQNVALALIEVYVDGERTSQFAWDNWAGQWIEGDWFEHTFHGPAGQESGSAGE